MSDQLAPLRRVGSLLAALGVVLAIAAVTAGAASAQTWTVDTTANLTDGEASCDPGNQETCTLREAIKDAQSFGGSEAAVVDATHISGTIQLGREGNESEYTLGGPVDTSSITVEGPGSGQLTIDGGGAAHLFDVEGSVPVRISGMTLSDAAGDGGAVAFAEAGGGGSLTLDDVHFTGNTAEKGYGGAIYQRSGTTLTLIDCELQNNEATETGFELFGDGGAIYSEGTLDLQDTQVGSTTQGNQAVGGYGGGVYQEGGSLTLDSQSSVEGNTADDGGGGIYLNEGVTLTLNGTEVIDNLSMEAGGGVDQNDGTVNVAAGARIAENTAETDGGGLYLNGGGNLTVSGGSTIEGNQARGGDGGGIYSNVPATVGPDVTVNLNQAEGDGALGGGIFMDGETDLTLTESTVDSNTSQTSGGGLFSAADTTTVTASTISNNLASGAAGGSGEPSGGGILVAEGDLDMSNSTVAGNVVEGSTVQGGGVAFEGSSATILNSTIARNSTNGGPSGGLLAATSTTVGSTILADNSASGGCDDAGGGGLQSEGHNIVKTQCGFPTGTGDQIGVDPQLGQLQNNGGETQTISPAQASSPAINAGANPAGLQVDQRGRARPVPAGNENTDVGAYEVQLPVDTAPPSIAGTPGLGQTLTCSPGSWNGDSVTPTYAYSWTSNGTQVGTGTQYLIQASDAGHQIGCTVAADNGAGAVDANSATVLVPAPGISVSPTGIGFGTQETGTRSTAEPVTITNTGGAPLDIGDLSLSGSAADQYAIAADACSAATLVPGGQCQTEIVFAPSAEGSQSASLLVPSTGGNRQVTLSGIGRPAIGALSVTPASLDFGTQETGTQSSGEPVTVTNTGDAPVEIGRLTIAGSDGDQYLLAPDGCSGETLAAGAHCEVEIAFTPTRDGGQTATLRIPSSLPTEEVTLSGIGRPPIGALAVTPTSVDFGTQEIGTPGGPRTITISNSGDAALTVGEPTIVGAGAGSFSLVGDGCSETTLAPADECEVGVVFSPAGDGGTEATLKIPSSTGEAEIELGGVGRAPVGELSVGPADLDFGTQGTGTSSTPRTVTIANTGDAPLTLGQPSLSGPAAAQFSLGDACAEATLAPGDGCHLDLTFAPTAGGAQVAALQIPSSVGTQTVSLVGTGETPSPPAPPANGSQSTPPPTSAGADLRVQIGGTHRAVVGRRLKISLTIANRGAQAAHDVVLTVKLTGAGVEGLAVRGVKCRGEHGLVCPIGSLAPGRARRLVLTATPGRAGRLDVVAGARGAIADPSPANDLDRWPIKVTRGR
jgi:predicted outer membrane repeat protein